MDVKELEGINGISVVSDREEIVSIRKGAWSSQEDSILINYIANHGEGHWNHLARNSGLKRTGKSCRMRWKNYLHPNVRRGNFTAEELLLIIQLHCLYRNRWSKIAGFLPGRTDNEIKNYWRTRVQRQAKELNYNVNSIEFRDFIRNIWLPRLSEQIHASKSCNNYVDDVITNFGIGVETTMPEPIQMDYYTSLSTTLSSEAHQVSETDHNLSNVSDCCFRSFTTSGLDFGKEIDNPAWLSYGDQLSEMLLRDDYFWACP